MAFMLHTWKPLETRPGLPRALTFFRPIFILNYNSYFDLFLWTPSTNS